MSKPLPISKSGKNFTTADFGSLAALSQFTFTIPNKSFTVAGKVFLKELLNLTSAEISLNNLPAAKSIPFYHQHQQNEEIYIFIRGEGEFQVDGCVFPLTEGTVVRVDPQGERCLRNTSDTEDLSWIVIQSRVNSQPDQTIVDGIAVEKKVSWQGKQRL